MSFLEDPCKPRMVEVVDPTEALRALNDSDKPVPFGFRVAKASCLACQAAPPERLRAEIAAADPHRTKITACILPIGHADGAEPGTAVHVGVVDGLPAVSMFALYQWVIL